MKTLYILRGLPGSGKTTLANIIAELYNVAADDYFDLYNGGEFNPNYLADAHKWCFNTVGLWMGMEAPKIAVHNTFTREWEFEEYLRLAKTHGYEVHTIIVENRHGGSTVHDVPQKAVESMRDRFEIKL
jgi:predicted kinase